MQKKVLVTDDCHVLLREGLVNLGYEVDFLPDISPEETLARIAGYEGLIINSKIRVNAPFLDAATQLRFVARLGSGMEIVDRPYAAAKGVAIISSPEGNRNAVAEQALGMLLTLANNLLRADREVRQNQWHREANRGWELRGKTIGIVGFGHTGSQFARKLQGMEMRVLAYDKYKTDYTQNMSWVEVAADLMDIQTTCDIISLHLPLTAETKHFVDTRFLAGCKPDVVIVNTSRGQCVHTADLTVALEQGRAGGACLDVFENEKPATYTPEEQGLFDRLYRLPNVVLSPHIAGWTHQSKRLMATILLDKIKILLKNEI
jgi:D-3-phosphoglycerate dehydrogenase / 2-oxoglutarate reductase